MFLGIFYETLPAAVTSWRNYSTRFEMPNGNDHMTIYIECLGSGNVNVNSTVDLDDIRAQRI